MSDRAGTFVAAVAYRFGVHPSVLSLANLTIGVGGSAAIFVAHDQGRFAPLIIVGAVLWQFAYILDCADGQLARASGKASSYGASVDTLVDVAVQISLVVSVGECISIRHELPIAVVSAFAAAWFVNFVTFLLGRGDDTSQSLLTGNSLFVASIKLLRDYGFVVLLFGTWLIVSPETVYIAACSVTAMNLVVLLSRITRDSALSMQATSSERQSIVGALHLTTLSAPKRSHPGP